MKRVICGLVLIYCCFAEYCLEAGRIKLNNDNNDVTYYQQLSCQEKYPHLLAQHGAVARVALKNHLRATDAFKAEAQEKKLRDEEAREQEARRQLLLASQAKKPSKKNRRRRPI